MPNGLRTYFLMVKWQLISTKTVLPLVFVVQLLVAVGIVYGMGFMYPSIDALSAKYIVTGATMMTLATMGLVLVPQSVAQMKERKTFDYLWSLPVSRIIFLLADFTIWTVVVLPGVVLSLALGSIKYNFDLDISLLVIPAFILIALTAVSLGMALAHLSPSPVLTGVITNVIMFGLFLFSPVNFPVDRLPAGLYHIHQVLPIMYMADLVRGTVLEGFTSNIGLAFGVVGGWCAASVGALYIVFTRRR